VRKVGVPHYKVWYSIEQFKFRQKSGTDTKINPKTISKARKKNVKLSWKDDIKKQNKKQ
jgi:hypothetical protein